MRADFTEVSHVLVRTILAASALVSVASVQAQDLTDEQRADIAARIAPVGEVCVQGANCGGLPKAPAPAMATAAPTAAPAPADAGAVDTAAADAASPDDSVAEAVAVAAADPGIDGAAIYNQACLACHASGVGGAPIVGDAGSWAPRIAKGIDALHNSGINGVAGTAMMAKGGRMDLSDAEVIAAVDYMVSSSQ